MEARCSRTIECDWPETDLVDPWQEGLTKMKEHPAGLRRTQDGPRLHDIKFGIRILPHA